MIQRLELSGIHMDVDERLSKYVNKKIGQLDKYISRKIRSNARVEVFLEETKVKNKNQHSCEVIFHLPHEILAVKEDTVNMYAAIDIVETRMKPLLKKYKDTHGNPKFYRRLRARFSATHGI